ncbi:hypothetical protein LTR56_011260 [Elasticomyces elasticus]|nr:hypothetical protein LTR56_011260 [Elasticomyces elasticus]KAK3668334.1 hypothetical protein LTR22_000625 [Elasticomyces elasticus]KAK4911011.1 hypothetical protein LTR49_020372 [Elasticomyces elasticus]KAK5756485.1 hypothetical protein LTS12_013439 [Elasticomyces elasticus]
MVPRITPAADAALAITELLESILVRVDAKTLLLSQRVSRNWGAVIEGSNTLQQKLFLQPATLDEAVNISAEDDDKALVVMRPNEDTRFMAMPERFMTFDILPESSGLLNPLLFDGNAGCRVPTRSRGNVLPSWTRMQLINPPQDLVVLERSREDVNLDGERCCRASVSNGPRWDAGETVGDWTQRADEQHQHMWGYGLPWNCASFRITAEMRLLYWFLRDDGTRANPIPFGGLVGGAQRDVMGFEDGWRWRESTYVEALDATV